MRIGVVSPEFPPARGGVETYAWEFSRELVRRGHEVTVFTVPQPGRPAVLPGGEVRPILKQRRHPDRDILRTYPVDAWHAMNAGYGWLALDMPQPVVVSVHGNDFLRPYVLCGRAGLFSHYRLAPLGRAVAPMDRYFGEILTSRLMQRALPRASHILANSRYTERVFLERFPACQGKTSTAWVGVAEDFFGVEHVAGANRVPRLVTVSRLSEPRKNVALILRALSALKDRYSFHYTIVGEGRERAALQALAHTLGLAGQVRFTGEVSDAQLREELSQSDLFVLTASANPYSHEGFGIVYIEANAVGVPVLAARLAGAAEAVEENVSGYFVEEPSVAAITKALDDFLAGRVRFDSKACRAFARQFQWERVVAQAETHYHAG
jgi:phosphatidylinositol alpha-1,6-mannosyltransferase